LVLLYYFTYIYPQFIFANPANRLSTKKHNAYHLLYIYSIPPDDGLQIWPKHVEVVFSHSCTVHLDTIKFLFYPTDSQLNIPTKY